MAARISEADEGKRVVDAEGDELGIVSGFRGGRAYVDPDPDLTDTILSKLGWENVDEDDYAIEQSDVERVTDDEVRLNR
jgi:hypothetical protein